MNTTPIQTKSLKLILRTPAEVRAEIETLDAAALAELSPEWLALLHASDASDPWIHGFAIIDRTSEAVIGTGGFKAAPADGIAEVAYGIDAEHQGKGFATEAAEALTTYAFASGRVRLVRAHTRPEFNASTRVLTKCGYRFVGEVVDPQDGPVWRWERTNEVA